MTTEQAADVLGRSKWWVVQKAKKGYIKATYKPGYGYDHDEESVKALKAEMDDKIARKHEIYRAKLVESYLKISGRLPRELPRYHWTPARLAGYRLQYRDRHGGYDPPLGSYWSQNMIEDSDRIIMKTYNQNLSAKELAEL